MTVAPPSSPPRPVTASLELAELEWIRVQLRIRLRRLEPGRALPAPDELRLLPISGPAIARLPDGGPAEPMPPTWAERDAGDELVARFNVMTGPGLRPLEPGTWVLAAADPTAPGRVRPLAVEPLAGVDPAGARAAFLTNRGEYSVQPRLDAAGRLSLMVALDPRILPPADPLRRRGGLIRRLGKQVRNWVFRRAVRVSRRLTRKTGRRILFLSHYGTELSGDMQSVLARMAERGLDREYEIETIRPLRSRSLGEWLRLPVAIGRADTIVIDEDVLFVFRRIDARVIQIWHASGALKTIGYSRVGKPGSRSPWSRHYRYFTYAIVAGEHDVPLFAEAFGIPEDRVIPTGHPRMDRFFDPAWRQAAKAETVAQFPEAEGRRVILFAPTWRQSPRGRVYDLSILDYARLHELCVEKDAVFIIRLHPTVREPFEIPVEYRDRILNGQSTVMDAPGLLAATDLLITDYSSIVLEYSLFDRPMLFFAHDLEEYKADRDVYMPYEEFVPGRIVETFDELVEAIRNEDYHADEVAPFAARHFSHFDQGATDRVIELILGRPPG